MFVIASALCIFVAILEALSETFVRGIKFGDSQEQAPASHSASNGSLNGTAKVGGSKVKEKKDT